MAKYSLPSALTAISQFLVFGDSIVALSSLQNGAGVVLSHFSLATSQLVTSIELPGDAVPTALVHPATYLHKVLVGLSNGDLALWNIRDGTLIHQFEGKALRAAHSLASSETEASSILSLSQTPALDVVAITTSDSRILLHDIKYDSPVMTFTLEAQLSSAPPTFRTDGRAHTMAVGSRSGDIFIFDLDPDVRKPKANGGADEAPVVNTPRLIHTIRNAHAAPISGLEFVSGQPLLISSAGDNAIKQWYFEPASSAGSSADVGQTTEATGSSSLPRLLKSREGHSEPPSLVRWYGEDGRAPLLSAGRDRSVRLGWVGREARGGELSQGSIVRKANQLSLPPASLKLEPATSLSFSLTRSRDWNDILTIHPGTSARMWLGKDRRMDANPLTPPNKKRSATEVATTGSVSHCGNFALVGMSDGTVGMFNMQSGRWVRKFDTRPILHIEDDDTKLNGKSKKKREVRGKGAKVVGVIADEGNKELCVATASGGIYFFDFYTTTLLSSQQYHPLVGIRASPRTTLVALIPLGLSKALFLIDFVTRRVVRKFGPFMARITDLTFSPTLRSLLIPTMDGSLSTFDVPSGLLIDRMILKEVIVSLDWSPDGSMIAGCGTEGKGIYLWSWSSGRGRIDEDEDEDVGMIDGEAEPTNALPSVRGPDEDDIEEEEGAKALERLDQLNIGSSSSTYASPQEPLLSKPEEEEGSRPLLTLSHQPRTKWTTLLNLDAIKARDRPKEAPKKPKSAPFFLGASLAPPESALDGKKANVIGAHFGTAKMNGTANGDEDEEKQTLLEQMTRRNLSTQQLSPVEQLLLPLASTTDQDEEEQQEAVDELFTYLLNLSPPQLDLVFRLELTTLSSLATFLRACALRLEQGKDYEAIVALVETLRRLRGEEMLGIEDTVEVDDNDEGDDEEQEVATKELKAAWSHYLKVQGEASERVGDLLDYNLGVLSFLRGVPVV